MGKSSTGWYYANPPRGKFQIQLVRDTVSVFADVAHEALHGVTCSITAFRRCGPLVEGATELLAQEALGYNPFDAERDISYRPLVEIAAAVRDIVGKEIFTQAYFNNPGSSVAFVEAFNAKIDDYEKLIALLNADKTEEALELIQR